MQMTARFQSSANEEYHGTLYTWIGLYRPVTTRHFCLTTVQEYSTML